MTRIVLYIIIGIGAISATIIPILFAPALLQQITYFPEDRPCTIDSCAEQIISNCQPSHIWLGYGALASSLKVNVTGWDGNGKCNLGVQIVPGELAVNPPPYYLCSLPSEELKNWSGWRNDAFAGIEEVKTYCTIRQV